MVTFSILVGHCRLLAMKVRASGSGVAV